MIIITSEFLDKNWSSLKDNSFVEAYFSEWDEGDTYTLLDIGPLSSKHITKGIICLESDCVNSCKIKIRLNRFENDAPDYSYLSQYGDKYHISALIMKGNSHQEGSIKIENISHNLTLRRKGILESEILKDKVVLIIGLGTGGIFVAQELAKCGVGNFIFVDNDRLEAGNIVRHSAGISCIGRKKINVAADLVREIDPSINVEKHSIRAEEQSKELMHKLINSSDLVICATDSRPSKLFINAICVEEKKTVILGGAFRRAYGGQIIRVRPNESACYHCFVMSMPDKEADMEISSQENVDAVAYSDQPVVAEPGLSLDVAPISLMVSKLALQELIKDKQTTLHILDDDFKVAWYLWLNRPESGTQYSNLPPLSDSID